MAPARAHATLHAGQHRGAHAHRAAARRPSGPAPGMHAQHHRLARAPLSHASAALQNGINALFGAGSLLAPVVHRTLSPAVAHISPLASYWVISAAALLVAGACPCWIAQLPWCKERLVGKLLLPQLSARARRCVLLCAQSDTRTAGAQCLSSGPAPWRRRLARRRRRTPRKVRSRSVLVMCFVVTPRLWVPARAQQRRQPGAATRCS